MGIIMLFFQPTVLFFMKLFNRIYLAKHGAFNQPLYQQPSQEIYLFEHGTFLKDFPDTPPSNLFCQFHRRHPFAVGVVRVDPARGQPQQRLHHLRTPGQRGCVQTSLTILREGRGGRREN